MWHEPYLGVANEPFCFPSGLVPVGESPGWVGGTWHMQIMGRVAEPHHLPAQTSTGLGSHAAPQQPASLAALRRRQRSRRLNTSKPAPSRISLHAIKLLAFLSLQILSLIAWRSFQWLRKSAKSAVLVLQYFSCKASWLQGLKPKMPVLFPKCMYVYMYACIYGDTFVCPAMLHFDSNSI